MLGMFRRGAPQAREATHEARVEPRLDTPAAAPAAVSDEAVGMRASPIPQVRRKTRHPNLARAALRHFKAGQQDRLTGSWGTTPLTADDIVRRHQRVLVARSREQCANNDYARHFLSLVRRNVVGPRGVQLQAQSRDQDGSLDTLANDAIERAWREWSRAENCDVTGRQSLRSLQTSAVTSAARDGEFMFRIVTGRDAGPWGIALQVIDPQRCDPDYHEDRMRNGHFIRHSIEFNRFGRPLAYHFTTLHPEDDVDAYTVGGRSFVRVPASQIVHGFLPDMVGQKRGLPWTATALWRLQMLGGFENAALVNARVSASKGGFFEWQEGYGPEADEDEEIFMEAEPGQFQELPAGVKFNAWQPQYPSGEFGPFQKAMLRGIASGLDVTYVNLANDLEGVNFSSIRQGTLDEREHWKEMQEWLVESMLHRVFEAWLPRAVLAGRIRVNGNPLRPDRLDKYREVEWQPRRWDWIDPNADVKAAVASKNNLLASPGQLIRDRGRDPDTVWKEIGRDIAAMRDANIPDEYIQIAMGMQLASQGDVQDIQFTEEDEGAKGGQAGE
ncbi:phage portal protein [Roseovarius ramblicola]|uniref:Phage portal protein n=1 Tax=Roseovarius ramblicola TaxID=2022336 RepID=A0ABV5HYN0_9RHOB